MKQEKESRSFKESSLTPVFKKSTARRECSGGVMRRILGATLAALLVAGSADAAILVDATNANSPISTFGTGPTNSSNVTFSADLAGESTGLVTGALSDANAVASASAILLNLRKSGAAVSTNQLSSAEVANLQSAIAAGVRVLIIGDSSVFSGWDQSFVSAVGSPATWSSAATNGATAVVTANDLTRNVGSVNISTGSTINGGTSLFAQNVAATFGPSDNVLLVMDVNVFYNSASAGNTQFQKNVADWLGASTVPEPSSWGMMILGFGAIGYCLRRRRKAFVEFG